MLVIVRKEYTDKYSRTIMNVGDEIVISKKRYNELVKAGNFVEEISASDSNEEKIEEVLEDKNGESEN